MAHPNRLISNRLVSRLALAGLATAMAFVACSDKSPQAPSPQPPTGTPTLGTPAIVSPSDDQVLDTVRPELRVRNVTSDQQGTRTYDFQVSRDGAFDAAASLIVNKSGIAEGGAADGTAYRVEQDLQTSTRYFWRARATQGATSGGWSSPSRFRTVGNVPPTIVSITANPGRVEVDNEVELTANVEDRETRIEDLTFEWSADKGAFSGTGSKVRWRAPRNDATPATYELRLTVIERYTAPRDDGGPGEEQKEHRVNGSTRMRVNDSSKEITNLVLTFLDDFSHSNISPETCVRNFSDSCRGKDEELGQIRAGRARADSISANFRVTDIRFNGDRNFAGITAPCEFVSRLKENGKIETAKGTCTLTSIYEDGRWWLCDSHFNGTTTSGLRFWF